MGRIAKRVVAKLAGMSNSNIIDLSLHLDAKRDAEELIKSVKSVDKLIQKGYDPLHAVYISTQNMVSLIAEGISTLPELRPYARIVGKAEDEYMPDGPPFSPLTRSYFTSWAFFDVQFGPDMETIGSCIKELELILGLPAHMQDVIQMMTSSRMGIYEHCGHQGSLVLLRDVVDQKIYPCYPSSGYLGKKSQLWFVRLMPPFYEVADYHVVFTTPYVLLSQKSEWESYFSRVIKKIQQPGPRSLSQSLELLFKQGLDVNYWNEYIFQAYSGAEHTVIYLAGMPDQPDSMPHSS
ncbi:MAG: hypothetical protein HQL94_09000 [Magnetococcales bacterium]|nr:hypothetical protein [Magnetococcales bacterium]MBF0440107.1 hypothetical protein [Magnetococcales bacterium]